MLNTNTTHTSLMSLLNIAILYPNPTKSIVNCVHNKENLFDTIQPSSICPRTHAYHQHVAPSCPNHSPPHVHFATQPMSTPSKWLIDFGVSYYVTTDLQNLFLHFLYNGFDNIMIGNGSGLYITHTGSTNLHYFSNSFYVV